MTGQLKTPAASVFAKFGTLLFSVLKRLKKGILTYKVLCFLDSLKEFLKGFTSVKSSVIVWVMLDTGDQ